MRTNNCKGKVDACSDKRCYHGNGKLQPGQRQERKPTDSIGHLVPAEVEIRSVGMDHRCGAVKRTNFFIVTDIWKRKKREFKLDLFVSFLNRQLLSRMQRLCQWHTKLVKNVALSPFPQLSQTHSCNTTAGLPPRLHTRRWLLQNLPASIDEGHEINKTNGQQVAPYYTELTH